MIFTWKAHLLGAYSGSPSISQLPLEPFLVSEKCLCPGHLEEGKVEVQAWGTGDFLENSEDEGRDMSPRSAGS